MITNLLLITIIVVNIIDLSGITTNIKNRICKFLNKPQQDFSIKPFDCSYCMTHWIGLFYLIITHQFSLFAYAILLFFCFMTPVVKDLMIWFKDLMTTIVDKLYFFLNDREK